MSACVTSIPSSAYLPIWLLPSFRCSVSLLPILPSPPPLNNIRVLPPNLLPFLSLSLSTSTFPPLLLSSKPYSLISQHFPPYSLLLSFLLWRNLRFIATLTLTCPSSLTDLIICTVFTRELRIPILSKNSNIFPVNFLWRRGRQYKLGYLRSVQFV